MTQPDVKLQFYPQFFLDKKKKKRTKKREGNAPHNCPHQMRRLPPIASPQKGVVTLGEGQPLLKVGRPTAPHLGRSILSS